MENSTQQCGHEIILVLDLSLQSVVSWNDASRDSRSSQNSFFSPRVQAVDVSMKTMCDGGEQKLSELLVLRGPSGILWGINQMSGYMKFWVRGKKWQLVVVSNWGVSIF